LVFVFFIGLAYSQEIPKDTINELEEVIITGQYSPQSVKKSVFDVMLISKKDIQQSAGNNLADLLNQNLNLLVVPNTESGRSEVSLFGLDGQYFKILIDNVPLVSDSGVGNNVDLTQINLDNVQQIEIVEGSMAVNYGGNSVTGIINIITKKSSRYKWEISPGLQEETVGNEYSWFDHGRHIQSIDIQHNISEEFYASAMFSRNDFAGFFDERGGRNYFLNDGFRGYEWLPKEQITSNALLKYSSDNLNVYYKYENFKEKVQFYNQTIITTYDENNVAQLTGLDRDYHTFRNIHHINTSGKIASKYGFQWDISYQSQERKFQEYVYNLYTRVSEYEDLDTYQSRKSWYSKGTINNLVESNSIETQLGYEANFEDGFGSAISGGLVNFENDVYNKLSSLDAFFSAEIRLITQLVLRPGVRYSIQSEFDNLWATSLSSKYMLTDDLEWRIIAGTSFRTPNYDELYTFVDDGNHEIYGNLELLPESSLSIFTYLKKMSLIKGDVSLSNKIKLGYLDVNDRISLSIVDTTPLIYKYLNIDSHKTLNVTSENSLLYKQFKAKIGATFLATQSKWFEPDGTLVSEDLNDFLYSLQINSSLAYSYTPWDMQFAVNYKFNGPHEEFVLTNDTEDNLVLTKGKTEIFHWMDASIKKQLFSKRTTITVGARNIFDVKELKTTAITGPSHGSESVSSIPLGYGRSYFLKIKHNFKF